MFQKLCIPLVGTQKKKTNSERYFKKKKVKLKQPAFGQVNSNLFNKEFVSSSYTSLKRRVTFKEFTPPVIIFSLATAQQTLLILCSVRVSVVLRLHSDAI